jgi:hypothetical protein
MQIAAASGATGCSRAPAFQVSHRKRAEWPRERLDQLRRLFDAGLSHLLIAGRMGVAKGVVSAKLARLGWRRGETLEALTPVRTAPPLVVEASRMRRLEQLGEDDCHWPVAEDAWGVQLFCGCARAVSGVYCEGHRARSVRRPRAWERKAMEPRPPAIREGFGWERFAAREREGVETVG